MTLKDSLDTKGVISTGGTKGRENFVPEQDATLVARLRTPPPRRVQGDFLARVHEHLVQQNQRGHLLALRR